MPRHENHAAEKNENKSECDGNRQAGPDKVGEHASAARRKLSPFAGREGRERGKNRERKEKGKKKGRKGRKGRKRRKGKNVWEERR